ncbi:MAG: hypothetical protein ACRDRH_10555 [Pseudonocardia sp.]
MSEATGCRAGCVDAFGRPESLPEEHAQTTDPSRLPAFEVEYAGVAEAGRHQVKFKMTRGPEQLHVTIGAAVLEPQEGIITSLVGGEVRRMIRNFMREIVLVTDPPGWPTEVQVEIIATCVDVDPPNNGWTVRNTRSDAHQLAAVRRSSPPTPASCSS